MNRNIALVFVSVINVLGPQAFAGEAEDIQSLLAQPGMRVEIYADEQPQVISQIIKNILSKPLSVDDAVQVSLFNNPEIQATLHEIRISRADRRQGRLLPNPHLEATYHRLHWLDTSEDSKHEEYKVLQDLNSLLFYPLKWRLSGAQYDEAKLRIADQILGETAEVKKAYFRLQAFQQKKSLFANIFQSVEAATELAKRQRQAGTLSALDLAGQEAMFYETRLMLARTDSQWQTAREEMNRLLGFHETEASWSIPNDLPKVLENDPSLPELEKAALSQRRDLAAARQELKSLDRQVTLSFLEIIPSAQAGVIWEREEGNTWLGPTGQIEIPLTDWNQAAISRARSKRLQGKSRLQGLEAQALSQVRTLFQRLMVARTATKSYEEDIIPLRMKVVEESQKKYNFMLSGVYQLLQAKQDEISSIQNYIESLEQYWLSRTELEQAIGAPLSVQTIEEKGASETSIKSDPHEHHHHGGKK